MDDLIKKIDVGIEEILLLGLILLNISEFIGFLPADLDYVKKIVSWVCLGYLLYKANLTEIFFGYKDKIVDCLLITAYFLLILKNFVVFSEAAVEEISSAADSFLVPLYTFILDNALAFELITFYIGAAILILAASINLFFNVEVKEPSIMAIIHEQGPPKNFLKRISRTLSSFFIYIAFFIVVFNLIMEWLAWAVDSSLLILGIFFYFFFFIKHSKKFHTETLIYKLGDIGGDFYERFMALFHSKKTILTGISGMLALHLLTDVGNFVIPYIIGKKIFYFVSLGPGHALLIDLVRIDLALALTLLNKVSVAFVYLINAAAILLLLIGPSYIWYYIYKNREIAISKYLIAVFSASFTAFLLSPVFRISSVRLGGLHGADILTQAINVDKALFVSVVSLTAAALLFLLCFSKTLKRIIGPLVILVVQVFFAYYLYYFSKSIIVYNIKVIAVYGLSNPFLTAFFIIFFVITVLFYLGGFAGFVYMTAKNLWFSNKKFI